MYCKKYNKVQHPNKRLAEKAMLSFFKQRGAEAFGSYQCPFCFCWHLTSEYDNRSKQSKREFRQYLQSISQKKKKKKDRREQHAKNTLSIKQQKAIFANFTPTVHNSPKPSLLYRILDRWRNTSHQKSNKST